MPTFLETYHALIQIIKLANNYLRDNFPLKKFQKIRVGKTQIERGTFCFKINNIELSSDKVDEIYRSLPSLLEALREILETKELEIRNTKARLDKLEEILAPELITNALKGDEDRNE